MKSHNAHDYAVTEDVNFVPMDPLVGIEDLPPLVGGSDHIPPLEGVVLLNHACGSSGAKPPNAHEEDEHDSP